MKLFKRPFGAIVFLNAMLFAWPNPASGQPNPVTDAFVILDSIAVDSVSCSYQIVLEDTNGIDQIEVFLSRSSSDTIPLVSHTFDYDVSAGLPSGWSYARKNGKITLELGNLKKRNSYFGRVKLKINGTWSVPYNFISQLTF